MLSLYFGFATYCLIVLIFGRTGIIATHELRDYHARLEANVAGLEQINTHLSDRLDALRSNPTTIRLEARQLGFLSPGEHVIEVSGYTPPPSVVTVGTLVTEKKFPVTTDAVSRLVGLVVACGSFILFELVARRERGARRR